VLAQRECRLCGEAFQVGGKRGRPRSYCYTCEPPGTQIVMVRGRYQRRRRRYPPRALRREPADFSDSVALLKLLEQNEADWSAWWATQEKGGFADESA
jgi:hypothetical protein